MDGSGTLQIGFFFLDGFELEAEFLEFLVLINLRYDSSDTRSFELFGLYFQGYALFTNLGTFGLEFLYLVCFFELELGFQKLPAQIWTP